MARKSAAVQLAIRQKKLAATKRSESGSAAVGGTLQERAMLVRLSTGRWYGRGTDESVIREVREQKQARGDVGTFTKRLMEKQHLAPIDRVVNEARRYHKEMTLPWYDQMRILSSDLFMDYKERMDRFASEFEKEVRKFLERFDDLKEGERKRLGQLFKESDYPMHGELRSRFYMNVRFEAVPDANDFRVRLGGDDVEAVKKQIEEDINRSLHEATADLWKRLHELVKKLRDVLRSSDGAVRSALFENLKDIVALMPKLNLTQDPKLEALTKRVQQELLKEDVEEVKESERVRSKVADAADSILDAMASFLGEDKPSE